MKERRPVGGGGFTEQLSGLISLRAERGRERLDKETREGKKFP